MHDDDHDEDVPLEDHEAIALAERLKMFIFTFDRPVARLARDVDDAVGFEGSGPLTPQLRLVMASPPLRPPAAAIVESTVRVWGRSLFETKSGRLMARILAILGPVGAVEKVLTTIDDRIGRLPLRLLETGDAYRAVVARYPDAWLAEARGLLARFRRADDATGENGHGSHG
jgi:hypothetical protein